MDVLQQIWDEISPQLNWVLIFGIIALGEITKRLWVSNKPISFWKVLIITLPATIIYIYFSKIDYLQGGVSYLLAYWLYPFLVKWVLDLFKLRSYEVKNNPEQPKTEQKSDLIGGRPNDR